MRQQYHFRNSDEGLLSWDVFRLIELSRDVQVVDIPLECIKELDEEFWYELCDTKPTCRNILEHAQLINETDLTYPIIMCYEGRVMDGMHRVCKAVNLGHESIMARQFSTYIEPDYVGLQPNELPYESNA